MVSSVGARAGQFPGEPGGGGSEIGAQNSLLRAMARSCQLIALL